MSIVWINITFWENIIIYSACEVSDVPAVQDALNAQFIEKRIFKPSTLL